MLYRNRLLCFHSGVWLWFVFGWCCVVCFAWLLFVLSSFVCFVSAWWIRGIADEVSIASFCKAVTGTAVMARSANEEKKKKEVVMTVGLHLCALEMTDQQFFFFLVSRTRHHSCAGHCSTIRSHCMR